MVPQRSLYTHGTHAQQTTQKNSLGVGGGRDVRRLLMALADTLHAREIGGRYSADYGTMHRAEPDPGRSRAAPHVGGFQPAPTKDEKP